MRKIRDSYSAQVWLEGSAVAFLDSHYPDDELSVQIARFISDGMKRTRKQQSSVSSYQSSSIQVLRAVPDVVEDKATSQRILDLETQNNELRSAVTQINEQLTQTLPPQAQVSALAPPPPHPTRIVPAPEPALPPHPTKTELPPEPAPEPASPTLKAKPSRGEIGPNAIGQLQEIAQQTRVKLPSYEARGSHPNFKCLCRFSFLGESHAVTGLGSNKKTAKVDAATQMLQMMGYAFT